MAQNPTYDLVNNLSVSNSIPPQSASAAVNGAGVDCTNNEGPIHLEVSVGAATGSPTSFGVAAKLQESPDNSTWTDMVTQRPTVNLTAAGAAYVQGIRTMKYVRPVVTPTFVGGTSPAIMIQATVTGQKRSY